MRKLTEHILLFVIISCIFIMQIASASANIISSATELALALLNTQADCFEAQCTSELLDILLANGGKELQYVEHRSGIEYSDIQYSTKGDLVFSNIVRFHQPVYMAENAEELIAVYENCKRNKTSDFVILCSEKLFSALSDDSFRQLQKNESLSGITGCDLSYSTDLYELYYQNVEYNEKMRLLSGVTELQNYIDTCIFRGDTNIDLLCSDSLFDYLMNPAVSSPTDFTPLDDIRVHSGIINCETTYNNETCVIHLENCRLFPGFKILLLLSGSNRTDVTAQDIELLNTANEIVDSLKHTDPVQTAINLNDWLCNHCEYKIDETTDTDDCAYGPILYGEANCSGYADAFYLLGSLAGFDVRYQHGDGVQNTTDAGHLWNAIRFNEQWYFIDTTWNDDEDSSEMNTLFFCIGQDLAALSHIWDPSTTIDLAANTDPLLHGIPEYDLRTSDMNTIKEKLRNLKPEKFGLVLSEKEAGSFSPENFMDGLVFGWRSTVPEGNHHWFFYDLKYQ